MHIEGVRGWREFIRCVCVCVWCVFVCLCALKRIWGEANLALELQCPLQAQLGIVREPSKRSLSSRFYCGFQTRYPIVASLAMNGQG